MRARPPKGNEYSSSQYFDFLTPPKKWKDSATDTDPYYYPEKKKKRIPVKSVRKPVSKGKK